MGTGGLTDESCANPVLRDRTGEIAPPEHAGPPERHVCRTVLQSVDDTLACPSSAASTAPNSSAEVAQERTSTDSVYMRGPGASESRRPRNVWRSTRRLRRNGGAQASTKTSIDQALRAHARGPRTDSRASSSRRSNFASTFHPALPSTGRPSPNGGGRAGGLNHLTPTDRGIGRAGQHIFFFFFFFFKKKKKKNFADPRLAR